MAKLIEADIFTQREHDLDDAFMQLYALYADQLYRFCYVLNGWQSEAAQTLVRQVFTKAYQYFHNFDYHQTTFRSYLFWLAFPYLHKQRERLYGRMHRLPKILESHWSEQQTQLWTTLTTKSLPEFAFTYLWFGAHFSLSEIAAALHTDEVAVQHWQTNWLVETHRYVPLFRSIESVIGLTVTQQRRLLRQAMTQHVTKSSFFTPSRWTKLLSPGPMLFMIVSAVAVGVWIWQLNNPMPLTWPWGTVADEPEELVLLSADRPHDLKISGVLPEITYAKRTLRPVTSFMYGSDYKGRDIPTTSTTAAEVHPTIAVQFVAEDYAAMAAAYRYAVPEALTQDQLQLAALRHFPTLAINRFVYVNGTYYIGDSNNATFEPLFIAFNNDGSVEYQMRQAAICQLGSLITQLSDSDATNSVFKFLSDHAWLDVPQASIISKLVSAPGKTVNKGSLCSTADTAPVQNRDYVIYPPHTVLRFDAGTDDFLPIRVRGLYAQLLGDTITQVRVDALPLLLEYVTKADSISLRPLHDAMDDVRKFYYPSSDALAESQGFQMVYSQWDHTVSDDRLTDLTLTDVHLEYVYDGLNHSIEPYYVFTGSGVDGRGTADSEVRMYVVASTKRVELRGPYRE